LLVGLFFCATSHSAAVGLTWMPPCVGMTMNGRCPAHDSSLLKML
jgi:hypothetical protein